MTEKGYPSQLLSGKKGTRLILRRDAAGLTPGQIVLSNDSWWKVDGRISRTGDVVISQMPGAALRLTFPLLGQ